MILAYSRRLLKVSWSQPVFQPWGNPKPPKLNSSKTQKWWSYSLCSVHVRTLPFRKANFQGFTIREKLCKIYFCWPKRPPPTSLFFDWIHLKKGSKLDCILSLPMYRPTLLAQNCHSNARNSKISVSMYPSSKNMEITKKKILLKIVSMKPKQILLWDSCHLTSWFFFWRFPCFGEAEWPKNNVYKGPNNPTIASCSNTQRKTDQAKVSGSVCFENPTRHQQTQHLQEIEAFKVVSVLGVLCWLNFFDNSIDTPYQTTPLLIFTDRSSFRCVFFTFHPPLLQRVGIKLGRPETYLPVLWYPFLMEIRRKKAPLVTPICWEKFWFWQAHLTHSCETVWTRRHSPLWGTLRFPGFNISRGEKRETTTTAPVTHCSFWMLGVFTLVDANHMEKLMQLKARCAVCTYASVRAPFF